VILLNAIWSDAPGKRVVLYKKGGQKSGGRNEFFDDNESAWSWLLKKNGEGYEVWFAMALFDGSGKRTKQAAKSVRSFWLDIDVGDEKPYANVDEAATSLANFCDRLSLPLPTLVGSGTGLHAHWIMGQTIDRERWEKTAKALKNATARVGLRAGPERTADIASVLRIPGTQHLKDPSTPRQVTTFGEIQAAVPLVAFEQALASFQVIDNARIANKVFETTLPQLPYDAEKIANECAVIGKMRETKGCVSEPVWYAALQVLHHCIDGEETAHAWSEGHPDYSYQATEEKFERAKEFGPTLCIRFGEYEPTLCAGCSHRDRITTPLQLGATFTPVTISVTPSVHASEPAVGLSAGLQRLDALRTVTPEYISPPHYKVGQEGVAYIDEDADDKMVRILDVPLWCSQLTDTVREADMEATFEWVTRLGRHRTSTMRMDTLMDLRSTGQWLALRGITGFNIRGLEAVKNYMWACVQIYQHTKDVDTVYEHFGWTDTGSFVIGDTLVSASSVERAKLAKRIPTKMRLALSEKGTLEAWAAATKSLAATKYIPHQFTLVAALLFSLLGVQGAVVSLAGDSGVGKTTISLFGLSAFGNPTALEISPQSTEKSFHERWYIASNLPVLINEAATLDLFKLSSLIYAAANGQARSTLTRTSELRESDGWQLLTIFTSNSHLMSLDEKWLNEANRRRILEFTLAKPDHEMDRTVALTLHRTMTENYGVAGRAFIQYCVTNRTEIANSLQSSYDLYAKGDVPAEHRFNLWTVAVARVAGLIAEKIGIVRFDTTPCYEWAVQQVKNTAHNVLTAEQKGDDVLADYISEHQGLFTRYMTKNAAMPWTVDVRGDCAGRYTQALDGSWTLSVPAARFATYMRERGVDKQHLKRWTDLRKVKTSTGLLVALGSRMRVYVIPIEGMEE
jgi:uncharacterized protein (DUF927 family)